MKSVAVIVQNIIQWYSVRPIVKYMLDEQIPVDVLVYDPSRGSSEFKDFHGIALDTINAINSDGFAVKDWSDDLQYHLCLAPYSDMINFKCKYRLGYRYGAITTKPSLTLQPEHKMHFHGFLIHDTYTADLASVYGKPYIVPDLYLQPIKHKKVSSKPVILYLPTYNEPSVPIITEALSGLKDRYYIITKGHHGTDHLNGEKDKKNLLAEVADENYDSNQYIQPLFEKADVVLSDNSGAAIDALYSKIPVVIATKEISPALNGINAIQQDLIDANIIPYVREISSQSLDVAIKLALTKQVTKLQASTSDKLFPVKNGGAKIWFQVIKQYLNDEVSQNYCKLHDFYVDKWQELKDATAEIEPLKKELSRTQQKLELYEKSRAHQMIEKIFSSRRKKQQ